VAPAGQRQEAALAGGGGSEPRWAGKRAARLRWVGPQATASGRGGRAEGLAADFAVLCCKNATTSAGRERN
jgi:hypothetical protein